MEYTREQRAADLRKRLEVYRRYCKDYTSEMVSQSLQLRRAQGLLLKILEGSDREAAIEEARTWLKQVYGDDANYRLMARMVNEVIPGDMTAIRNDGDFPEEIDG